MSFLSWRSSLPRVHAQRSTLPRVHAQRSTPPLPFTQAHVSQGDATVSCVWCSWAGPLGDGSGLGKVVSPGSEPAVAFALQDSREEKPGCHSVLCMVSVGLNSLHTLAQSKRKEHQAGGVEPFHEVNVRHFEPGQFTGRKEEMARLMRWLTQAGPESRRLAIVGQGGSGKRGKRGSVARERGRSLWHACEARPQRSRPARIR